MNLERFLEKKGVEQGIAKIFNRPIMQPVRVKGFTNR